MAEAASINLQISVPPNALVLLIGAAGSGKSTFARRWFSGGSIVSSDQLRASAQPQGKKRRFDVFNAILAMVDLRVKAGTLTVVDATNTDWMRRSEIIRTAREQNVPVVAIVFALPLEECLAQNAARSEGAVPARVIRGQAEALSRDLDRLDLEGYASMSVFRSRAEVDAASVDIERGPVSRASHS